MFLKLKLSHGTYTVSVIVVVASLITYNYLITTKYPDDLFKLIDCWDHVCVINHHVFDLKLN